MSRRALALTSAIAWLGACSGGPGAADAGHHETPDAGRPDAGMTALDAGPRCPFVFHYGQGFPCNQDSDCTTGRCYFPLNSVSSQNVSGYCTVECDPSQAGTCPTGTSCEAAADRSGNVCALASGTSTLPGDGSLPFGSPCGSDSDCAGTAATCGFVDNPDGTVDTFCTSSCNSSMAAGCGLCGACVPPQGGGSDQCQPMGDGAIGAMCQSRTDCATFDCRGFCTQLCSSGGQVTPCPTDTICEPVVAGGQEFGLCILESQIGGTPTGGGCTYDFQCASGDTCRIPAGATSGSCEPGATLGAACTLDTDCAGGLVCRDVAPGRRVPNEPPLNDPTECTRDCSTPCGSGNTCVVLDLDTDLQLFWLPGSGASASLLAENDDINPVFGDRWSSVTQTLPAGTYVVEVNAYSQSFGSYVLEISDGVNAEGQTTQVEPNNTLDTAQAITVPTKVAGTFLQPGENDYYSFTLSSTATLTIQIEPGPPSACLPNTQVGQIAWGSACTTNYQCASGLCEQALQLCGQPCTENSDCGGVNPPPPDAGSDAGPPSPDGGPDAGWVNPEPVDAGPPQPICADFLTHHSCVKAADHDDLTPGAFCYYSFECENGYCADYQGSIFCTQTCTGPGANCGIVVNGMSSNACEQMTVSPSGVPVSDYACVPTPDGGT